MTPTTHFPPKVARRALVSVEIIVQKSANTPAELINFDVDPALRKQLTHFYGALARDVKVFVTGEELPGMPEAYCEGRTVVLQRRTLERGRENLHAVLAHEFAHVVQQCTRHAGPGGLLSVLDSD